MLSFLDPLIRESTWAIVDDLLLQIESDWAGFPFALFAVWATFALVWWFMGWAMFAFVVAGFTISIAWYVV